MPFRRYWAKPLQTLAWDLKRFSEREKTSHRQSIKRVSRDLEIDSKARFLLTENFRFVSNLSQSRFSLLLYFFRVLCVLLRVICHFYRKSQNMKMFSRINNSVCLFVLETSIDFDSQSFIKIFATTLRSLSLLNSLVFLSHGNLFSTFSLSNGTEYTEKSFPFVTKIDLVLKKWRSEEFSREKEKRFSRFILVIISLSVFPKGKFVVGRKVSWIFRGFLRFLHSPTTRRVVHCAVDAAEIRAW